MLYKNYYKSILVTVGIVLGSSCSDGYQSSKNAPDQSIGSPLKSYMPRYMKGMEDQNLVFTYDSYVNRIHQFNAADMELKRSFPVRSKEQHQILTGKMGHYIIDISSEHIDLILEDGTRQENILSFTGTPETTAFLPTENLFVIVDSLKSIGLIELNDQGEVLGSWIGGSKLLESSIARAGDLLPSGELILTLSDLSFAVIDVRESIQQKSWVFRKTDPLEEEVLWVAAIPDNADMIYCETSTKLFTYELSSGSQIAELILNSETDPLTVSARFRDLEPHTYVTGGTTNKLWYPSSSGSLESVVLPDHSFTGGTVNIAHSVLDQGNDIVTVVEGLLDSKTLFNYQTILRLRLTDNLVVTNKKPSGRVAAGISANHILFQYDSPLGFIEVTSYDQGDEPAGLKGFNLPFIAKE